ncbi:hypothetical protein E2C01_030805 [Portunus trituberculatus]|uniref:Uncharacterized protein n=1 Tax=Portunus trituberculatus TaxID=210409 RepID=A0A5B7ES01_PORTR|nr:hypothetical protein [Portunus trituberculatus]
MARDPRCRTTNFTTTCETLLPYGEQPYICVMTTDSNLNHHFSKQWRRASLRRGSNTPRTAPHSNLPHPAPINSRTRATQNPHCYSVTLTWSPVLIGADKPPTPGQSLPSIIGASQPSNTMQGLLPGFCDPDPETSTIHAREAAHTWLLAP